MFAAEARPMISPNGIAHIQLTVRDVASTASFSWLRRRWREAPDEVYWSVKDETRS